MNHSLSRGTQSFEGTEITVLYLNFWSRGRAKIDNVVHNLGLGVTVINPDAASTIFGSEQPDVVILGFGGDVRRAVTFLFDYKSSPWFRRVPLVALIESGGEDQWRTCIDWGCDEAIRKPIASVYLKSRIRQWVMRKRQLDVEYQLSSQASRYSQRAAAFAEIIVPLGVAMMAEADFDHLLEMILTSARRFCNADGGTLYLIRSDEMLDFKIIVNESMNILYRSRPGEPLPFKPISLHLTGKGGLHHIACHVAVTGQTVNVEDVYHEHRFDCSGALNFDRKMEYRTRSLLTIALRDKAGVIIGVLQLVNAMDRTDGSVISFDPLDQEFIERLSLLAGQALDSYRRMAQLRRQANALVIRIDEREIEKQVGAVVSSEYFKNLKAKSSALQKQVQPMKVLTNS